MYGILSFTTQLLVLGVSIIGQIGLRPLHPYIPLGIHFSDKAKEIFVYICKFSKYSSQSLGSTYDVI